MEVNSDNEFQPETKLRVMRKKKSTKCNREKYLKPVVPTQDASPNLFASLLPSEEQVLVFDSRICSNAFAAPSFDDDPQSLSERNDSISASCTPADDDNPSPVVLTKNTNNRTYLITYSKAEEDAFPTRESFADLCALAFGGTSKVSWYACAKEPHQLGGFHYHVTIKLFQGQRWGIAKEFLERHGAVVNFARPPSADTAMYAWMFKYICKYDKEVYLSSGHPSLEAISSNQRCQKAISSQMEKRKKKKEAEGAGSTSKKSETAKSARLKEGDVATYCRKMNIRTLDELMADGETRRVEGDNSLFSFIFGRTIKSLNEMLTKAWMMHNAVEKVKNLAMPRMTALSLCRDSECLESCDGLWLTCALDLLKQNNINKYLFAHSIRELLEKGRGKQRNLFLMGPHTSGKTFLLKPLLTVYPQHFNNPAASSFGWLHADEASIILLNDFRWETKLNGGNIEWGTLLNLLEGFSVSLPAPMNTYSKNIRITSDVPIFATSPDPIRWYAHRFDEPRGKKHAKEDGQIDCRWKMYELTRSIPDDEKIDGIPDCPACFAKMAYLGLDD